jgi:2-phospho-L-lactate/phosphoenolpyruvate guanylyltransferase
MSLWAIVPVKPLRRGKSRLAGVLTDEERTFINYSMLGNTLKALHATSEVDHVLVVSRDPGALALARDFEAKTLQEDGDSDNLNLALKRATVVAQLYAAQRVLILPADLPLIDSISIRELVSRATNPPVIVIAPDRRHEGTNALLVSPAGLIDYQFGVGSFARHTAQAQQYKVRVEVLELKELGLDLDLPEDLNLLRQLDGQQFHIPHTSWREP